MYITPLLTLVRGTLSAPFWSLWQKLSLSLLYFNKTLLHKSCEWWSLVSSPRLNSSPLESNYPGFFPDLATTFHKRCSLVEGQALDWYATWCLAWFPQIFLSTLYQSCCPRFLPLPSENYASTAEPNLKRMKLLGRQNREKESKMAVAKRQGRSKEGPRTRVKTSDRTNSTPG